MISLSAAALSGCASSAASAPASAYEELEPSTQPVPSHPSGFVKLSLHGLTGVWIEAQAYTDMIVGFQLRHGELKEQLAAERTLKKIAVNDAEAVRRSAASLQWRALWGPVIAFVGGVCLATALVVGAVYAGKALNVSGVSPGGLTF